MHAETNTNGGFLQQQQNQQHQQQHQQQYMIHLNENHLHGQQHQQQVFTHLSINTTQTITSTAQSVPSLPVNGILNEEGTYTSQNHLIPEYASQYYSSSRFGCATTPSSSSPSSSSSSSSNDSSYPCSSFSNHTCRNKNNASIGVNLRVTGQCSQGGRKYMEDYFSVAYQQSENAKDLEYAFIGIYDGHGGAEAAKFAKEHLMMEIINQRLFWSDHDHDVLRAIREGYIATHYAMWREQDKWPKTANGLPSTAGTTATVAFIRREKIYIGHVGDSGIVLGYQNENENFWRAKQLTTDHKPESVEERTRIQNSGGKVVIKSGVPRVVWNRPRNASHRGPIRKKTLIDEIPFLAVARSLGDLWSYNSERNEFVVSPDPDVKVIPINSNTFRCLIFGTDGLWNVVSAQEAVNTVREKEIINERLLAQRGDSPHEKNQWTNPSKSLVEQALRTWSNKKMRADNTSVVTVILYPPGQEGDDYSQTSCKETTGTLANAPSFVQPISYGLEYTQVQAEIPAYDNATTYKEMALKYLPPEEYRNFNYYADDSDTEGEDNDENEEEIDHDMVIQSKVPSGDLHRNMEYHQHLPTNTWNWQTTSNGTAHMHDINRLDVEERRERDEDDDCDEDEDDGVMDEDGKAEENIVNNDRQVCFINYQNYIHMDAEETNNATDSYINTFAESYNTMLSVSQDERVASISTSSASSNSNSNSNSNCQSITPPNMYDILQEQQLYQQQCMFEEEGYSLTKLETRREQQTCKMHEISPNVNETTSAVHTFKIVHESEGHSDVQNPQQFDVYHMNTERYYHHHQFISQIPQKPLELDSLLQQEREEEQQVAYERLQMENKLAAVQQQDQHQNIAAYACLQAVRNESMTLSANAPLEEHPAVEVEYLDDEDTGQEIIAAEASCSEPDESVQINEISSSCDEDTTNEVSSEAEMRGANIIEKIEKIEILPNVVFETSREDVGENEGELLNKEKSIKVSKSSICLPLLPPSTLALTPLKSCLTQRNRRTKSYLYANVPNENIQRISSRKNSRSMYSSSSRSASNLNADRASEDRRRGMCMTPSGSMTSPIAATSTPMIQRQLRSTTTPCTNSNTPMVDYGKRTLRTRNSMSKDMKAKSSMVQTALKYPHNAVTRNFLRTTTANLMVGKSMLLHDQHLTPCNRRSLSSSKNVHSSNRNSIKTRREKSGTINGSLNQNKLNMQNSPHNLNLRPRQPPPTSSNSSPPTKNISALRSAQTASASVIKRASLTDRRILRSMHTRSTSSKGSQNPANFSKSTRTQSTGSNLAAPPPSPKMINAAAVVVAATRTRSLLNAKHVAAAQSVVSSVFVKRTSLRSNGATHSSVLPSRGATHSPVISSVSAASKNQTLRGRIVKKLKR